MASTLHKLEIGKYKGDDYTLIQCCRTVVEHINKYKAQFIAFDVPFDSWYPLRCFFRATVRNPYFLYLHSCLVPLPPALL